jgi:hypothetical protein
MWLLGIFRTSAHSGQPCSLQPKDLFIIILKYTIAYFRCTRRRRQISLRVVVSHHVVARIWTQDLWKSSQCSYPLSHLTRPWNFICIFLVCIWSKHPVILQKMDNYSTLSPAVLTNALSQLFLNERTLWYRCSIELAIPFSLFPLKKHKSYS